MGRSDRLSTGNHKRFQTKQEWVYSELKSAIQTCAFMPGDRLILDEVAGQYGVSRVPVREALLQLQVEGLVEMSPHAGATVAPISLDSISDLFKILEELEALAVKAAARRASEDDLSSLDGLVTEMRSAMTEGDLEAWSDLNTSFHLEICRASAMSLLPELTERALERWDRMRRCFIGGVLLKRVGQASDEHEQILEALKARDVEGAEKLIRVHNREALKSYLDYLDGQTDGMD